MHRVPLAKQSVDWNVATSPIASSASTTATRPRLSDRTVHAGALLDRWHLLSLDAPTVAVVWSWAFARCAHIYVPWLSTTMLAVATWLLYVADRLLDGLQGSDAASLQERHRFHLRHRTGFLAAAVPALALLAWFVANRMEPAPRREDCILGFCALLYLLCVHLPFSGRTLEAARLPKELFVGVIFAAACVIPAWSRQAAARPMLLLPAIFFAALCWLNCAAIEHWESRLQPAPALSHRTTHWIGNHLGAGCFALAGAAVLSLALPFRGAQPVTLDLSIASSALLLRWLHRNRHRWKALRIRAAADVVLLTPVILVPGVAWIAQCF